MAHLLSQDMSSQLWRTYEHVSRSESLTRLVAPAQMGFSFS
jgi:hypothetical protein